MNHLKCIKITEKPFNFVNKNLCLTPIMYIFTPNLPLVLDQPIKINYYAISSLGAGNIGPGPHFISLIKRTRKAQNSHLGLEPPLGFPFTIFSTFHRPRKNSGNEMKLCS